MAAQRRVNPSRGEAGEHLNNGNKPRGDSWWKDATMEPRAVYVSQTQRADPILVISSLITHPHL